MLVNHGAGRMTPSAGAIYPFEVWIGERNASPKVAILDLRRRRIVTSAVLPDFSDSDALIVVRPWLAARKYGPRGVAYALLDTGHALTNLLVALAADPKQGSDNLLVGSNTTEFGQLAPGRFIAARLPVKAVPTASIKSQGWSIRTHSSGECVAEVSDYESDFARRLTRVGIIPQEPWTTDLSVTTARSVLGDLPIRRSASTFTPGLGTARATEVLRTAHELWTRVLARAHRRDQIRATLFSRERQPERFDASALGGQEQLLGAEHIVSIAIPVEPAVGPVSGETARAILAAGSLGQCIYLAATAAGVGVTGIGGFSPTAFGASNSHWPIYCMALGQRGGPASKLDALATANAHGFSA